MDYRTLARINDEAYNLVTGSDNEVEFLFAEYEDCIVISVRGTEPNFFDILRDIRFFPWRDKRVGWAHAGFLHGAKAIEDEVIEELVHRPEKDIYVTGHSLGGAVALILGKILHYERFKVKEIVTFGAPKAVLKWSKDRFKHIKVTQFRNGSDMVTTVPYSWLGYTHINLVQIGETFNKDATGVKHYHYMRHYIDNVL